MSLAAAWPGAEIVFFDCDSTLAAIEGIDQLAVRRGVDVAALTQAAMAGEVPLGEVFRTRLEHIAPCPEDLAWVAQRYRETQVEDAEVVVAALQQLGIACHVVSGGLRPAVEPFAASLGFSAEQVHAVPFPLGGMDFAAAVDVACAHPLARDGGKSEVIVQVCSDLGLDPHRAMLVGDGNSDLEAAPQLGLFVGFGGVVVRERVQAEAPTFLPGPGLAAVALLAAGPGRASDLQHANPDLFAAAKQQLALVS